MPSYLRTTDQIANEMESELRANTPITNFQKGSRARGLVRAFAAGLVNLYSKLDEVAARAFLSTASGEDLDAHGYPMAIERMPGESDENYRMRIRNAMTSHAKGNYTAVMDTAMSVLGVSHIEIARYTHGPGSFTVFVLTEHYRTLASVVQEVQTALEDVVSEGVRCVVRRPTVLSVSMEVRLALTTNLSTSTNDVRTDVQLAIRDYIDSIPMGGRFVSNQFIRDVMQASPYIADLEVTKMMVGELGKAPKPVFFENFATHWDEKLYVTDLSNIVVI